MNPDLAYADRRSLFNSCARCAHDGLYPDGKEAALVTFNTKVKRRVRGPDGQWLKQPNGRYVEKEYWAELVQYLPMIAGIRKRMRNTGQVLSADAEVVHERDEFRQQGGDDPKITHTPPPLSQDRGRAIGAYAIIRLKNGEVLREVMSYAEIEHVRNTYSKGNNPAWVKSWGEMARKTVLRRCSKAAPTGSDLDELLARDEEYDQPDQHTPMREIPPRPDPSDYITVVDEEGNGTDQKISQQPEPEFQVVDFVGELTAYQTAEEARDALLEMIKQARSLKALEGLWESNTSSGAVADIADAIEDGAEPLHQAYAEAKAAFEPKSGNGQDLPQAGNQPAGATASQTEHPEERQSSTPTERRTPPIAVPQNTTGEAAPRDEPGSLAVPLRKAAGGKTDWEGTAADMEAKIATLTDPAQTAPNGGFMTANRQTLELMRSGNRNAWSTVNYRLNDRYRVLQGGEP